MYQIGPVGNQWRGTGTASSSNRIVRPEIGRPYLPKDHATVAQQLGTRFCYSPPRRFHGFLTHSEPISSLTSVSKRLSYLASNGVQAITDVLHAVRMRITASLTAHTETAQARVWQNLAVLLDVAVLLRANCTLFTALSLTCRGKGPSWGRNPSCLFGTNHCLHTSTQH